MTLLACALVALATSSTTRTFIDPTSGLTFVLVPAGTFQMGSPAREPGHRSDERQHAVTFTRPFYMAATEVTQRAWMKVMGSNPSRFRGDSDRPVENVTWHDAQKFIERLNGRGDGHYRLPTEAEWEYACRAGTTTSYSFGDRLSSADANYDARYPLPGQAKGRYRNHTVKAASFPPNAWGLFDMHGNVWEWCEDDYCTYPNSSVVDPEPAQCRSGLKIIRGGSWYFNADSARSALRYTHAPHLRGFSLGFRVVRDVESP